MLTAVLVPGHRRNRLPNSHIDLRPDSEQEAQLRKIDAWKAKVGVMVLKFFEDLTFVFPEVFMYSSVHRYDVWAIVHLSCFLHLLLTREARPSLLLAP